MCRAGLLNRTLHSLSQLPGLHKYAVYVSQDGDDADVDDIVSEYGDGLLAPPTTRSFEHWQKARKPLLGPDQVLARWRWPFLN